MLADEAQFGLLFLPCLPLAVGIDGVEGMYALEDAALPLPFVRIDDAFVAEEIRFGAGDNLPEPGVERVERDRLGRSEHYRLDLGQVVIMLLVLREEVLGETAEALVVKEFPERHVRLHGFEERGALVEQLETLADRSPLFVREEIGLVEDEDIGQGDLLPREREVAELLPDMLAIDDGNDSVELIARRHYFVEEKGLDERQGISQARRLDHHPVEMLLLPIDTELTFGEFSQCLDQVYPHRATEAAVVELDHGFVTGDDELAIDPDLAELIDDDRDLLVVIFAEHPIEESCLARTEKTGEEGHRDLLIWFVCLPSGVSSIHMQKCRQHYRDATLERGERQPSPD